MNILFYLLIFVGLLGVTGVLYFGITRMKYIIKQEAVKGELPLVVPIEKKIETLESKIFELQNALKANSEMFTTLQKDLNVLKHNQRAELIKQVLDAASREFYPTLYGATWDTSNDYKFSTVGSLQSVSASASTNKPKNTYGSSPRIRYSNQPYTN